MNGATPGRTLALGILALTAAGCAEPEPTAEQIQAIERQAEALSEALESAGPPARGVVVRLMFGEDVDLDLYVTDPLLETVYFARHESRTGGLIESDVRCGTTGPRIEEIRFPEPWPGRYRVGVDYPHRCDGSASRAPAPYAVAVLRDGKVVETTHGLVNREFFEVRVLEFDIEDGEPVPTGGGR